MRALTYAVVVLSFCASNIQAQTSRSYDAIVVEDGAYIRSGGGEKYYPTGRLAKGQRVRVHRHDPGGWYQISPPEGSYSWILKKYVEVTRPGVGEIKERGAVAWVGTDFGREASVFQRMLSKNEQVQIIGEGRLELDRDRGPEAMYKIKPPRGEYRWVPGRALIPADEANDVGSVRRNEPVRKPLNNEQFLSQRPEMRRSSPKPRRETQVARRESNIDRERIKADLARLEQLDELFRSIVDKSNDPSKWNFEELEAGYRTLRENAANSSIANQVAMRMPALKRYKRKKALRDEVAMLTSATTRRDQQLARMSSGVNGGVPAATEILGAPPRVYSASMPSNDESTVPVIPPQLPAANAPTRETRSIPKPSVQLPRDTVPVPKPSGSTAGNGNGKQSFPPPRNNGTVPIVTNQQPGVESGKPVFDPPAGASSQRASKPAPIPSGMEPSRVRRLNPKFVGAGVIMRSTELDVPKYVLLSPNGRILAYLEAEGSIDLSKHVNFAMGINDGDRFYNPKWKAEYIRVRGVEPITFK